MSHPLKKIMAGILCAGMVASMAACSGSAAPGAAKAGGTSDKQVTLKLWHIWASETESSKKPFEKVLADFQKQYPNIKIEVDATENEAYKTKIRATVAANEAPDIFFYWGGGYMNGFVKSGKLLPLNDYLNDGTKDKLLEGTLSNMTYDGKVYGLPHSMAVGTFFVNQEMFDKNGIKVPTTYDELVAAVKAFRDKGVKTPMAVGGKEAWCVDMYLDMLQLRQGGYDTCINALSGKGSFEEPGIIDGAKRLQELVKMGAFGDNPMSLSRDESEVPFYNGEVPMYLNGSWTIGNIMKDTCKVKDKIKIYPFPSLSDKSSLQDFTGGVSEIFVVNANTQHKEEAVTALKYISENFSREVFLAGAGLPTYKLQGIDETKIDPLTQQLLKMTKSAKTYTLWWNTYLDGANSELYMNKSAELFAMKTTPEQYAKDLQTMNKK
jgi:raffinose/stachyose/melibiose transport system substrate-binding protein